MIDVTQITNTLQQLIPVILQVAILGAVLSIIFGFLIPMIQGLTK
jgi:hypothetical protein